MLSAVLSSALQSFSMLHQDTAKQIQVQLVYVDFQPQLSLSPLKAAMEFLGQSS